MTEIMERYFGQNCFKKPGFKIQTLGIACILFGVDRRQLLQEFKKVQNCGGRTETESLDHFG